MKVLARHVLCFLGRDGSFDDLADAIVHEIAEVAPGFKLDREFSVPRPDGRMSASFEVCRDRVHPNAFLQQDEDAVAAHGAVLYVLSPPMEPSASVGISAAALDLVDRMLRCGATAAKGESAGVAHGAARWSELAAEARAAKDATRLSSVCRLAFAKRPIGRGDYLASVGFHLVGLPDVMIPWGAREEIEVVREIDRAGDMMAGEGVAAALAMLDGQLEEDSSYEPDEFKFNPLGIIRARARLKQGSARR